GYLPEPPDITARLRQPAGDAGGKLVTLSHLEAPSNFVAFNWLRKMDLKVARIQSPDPRLPRGRVDFLLWKYDDTWPTAAVSPPAPKVAHAVAEIASQPFHLDVWRGYARRLAQQVNPEVEDLLATMVYPPGVSQMERPALWVYRVQVAAA